MRNTIEGQDSARLRRTFAARVLGQPVTSLEELSRHCARLEQENAEE
jgi:hypothetical protein